MSFSIYHNATNDRKYKAATGLDQAQFEELYQLFAPFYTPKNEQIYGQQVPPVLTDKREALFFILHYYKAYPTLQNMGTYFGFSDYAASVYIERLKPCLTAALRVQTWENNAVFRSQKEFDDMFAGVEDLVIDVTEIPIERSVNQQVQKNHFSGKKNFTP